MQQQETLTLQDIAPYLQHQLLVIVKGLKHPAALCGIIDDQTVNIDFETGCSDYSISDIKPLLIPLNELTPELAIWIKNNNIMRMGSHTVYYIEWWLNEILKNINECPFIICQKIFELHGDLNGLIDRGLALNKLTWNQ